MIVLAMLIVASAILISATTAMAANKPGCVAPEGYWWDWVHCH